jgi:hypothetical protein
MNGTPFVAGDNRRIHSLTLVVSAIAISQQLRQNEALVPALFDPSVVTPLENAPPFAATQNAAIIRHNDDCKRAVTAEPHPAEANDVGCFG